MFITQIANSTDGKGVGTATSGGSSQTSDHDLYNYIFVIMGCLIVILGIWRIGSDTIKYLRTVVCINNDTQRYFATPSRIFAALKRHFIYAPIVGDRHNKNIQLSARFRMGCLPTRLQCIILIGYCAVNIAFCFVQIQWHESYSTFGKQLRVRTGALSMVNMIPLFVMASRNNPLIRLLNLSYDTFNLFHRWIGRIVVIEAISHTLAWAASIIPENGWAFAGHEIMTDRLDMYGFVGLVALVFIFVQASSIFRFSFYESFKVLHLVLVVIAIVGLYFHLKLGELPQLSLLYLAIATWVAEQTFRTLILTYRNLGNGGSKAIVETLPGNICRVTINLARPWHFRPGQHAYIYMPSIGLWQSHPFSVAWSEESDQHLDEKLALHAQDILTRRRTTVSFLVKARNGFTKKLHERADSSHAGRFTTRCFVEGPYGGLHTMHSYGTVIMFAGGIGITHQIPHVRDLIAGHANGYVATRKVVLVWIIQSPEHLEWVRGWMTSILTMDKRRDILRILLFTSQPRSTKKIHSPSASVQMFPGRPNIVTILKAEMQEQLGATGVSVCGPGSLSDDVRRAVRNCQYDGNIDFIDESFSL